MFEVAKILDTNQVEVCAYMCIPHSNFAVYTFLLSVTANKLTTTVQRILNSYALLQCLILYSILPPFSKLYAHVGAYFCILLQTVVTTPLKIGGSVASVRVLST